MALNVNLKWGKQKYTLELNTSEPPIVFKSQIYALTGVPPERQKVMGVKGGVLKDDGDWSALGVKEGHNFMLMGSAEEIPKAPEKKTVFVEDLSSEEANLLIQSVYPPGLTNLGNTCYMNATLQCLRKVPELTTALKSYKGVIADNDPTGSISAALRDLFVVMDLTNQPAAPVPFLTVLRQAYPQFAQEDHGRFMQQDADECWGQLMVALSQKLPRAPGVSDEGGQSSSSSSPVKPSVISDLFTITKETVRKCEENDEPPTTEIQKTDKLICHIGNTTSFLVNGLKEGLEEPVTKHNETLGRNAKYTQTSRITKLPYYLTVQFMRFFWRADKNTKAKIVRPVEFPFILDVYDLCTPELQKELAPQRRIFEVEEEKRVQQERERARRKAEDPDAKDPVAEAPKEDAMQITPTRSVKPYTNDTGKYELIAVLTHKGREAESGHYVAWVKQAEDKWIKFDDDKVSEVRNDDIKKLDGKGGGDWHIAYICLYRTYSPY